MYILKTVIGEGVMSDIPRPSKMYIPKPINWEVQKIYSGHNSRKYYAGVYHLSIEESLGKSPKKFIAGHQRHVMCRPFPLGVFDTLEEAKECIEKYYKEQVDCVYG